MVAPRRSDLTPNPSPFRRGNSTDDINNLEGSKHDSQTWNIAELVGKVRPRGSDRAGENCRCRGNPFHLGRGNMGTRCAHDAYDLRGTYSQDSARDRDRQYLFAHASGAGTAFRDARQDLQWQNDSRAGNQQPAGRGAFPRREIQSAVDAIEGNRGDHQYAARRQPSQLQWKAVQNEPGIQAAF